MKSLLTLTLVVLMAGSVLAQDLLDNRMGIFFSDMEFTEENTNFDPAGAPFDAYIVIVQTTMFSVGGYECGVAIDNAGVFVLAASGPNGWTNFGNNTNHLVGFQTPVPSDSGAAVLGVLNLLYSGTDLVNISMGPSDPSSVGGEGPAVADGSNPDILYTCPLTPCEGDIVATLNGPGIEFCDPVATESQSWTNLKALF